MGGGGWVGRWLSIKLIIRLETGKNYYSGPVGCRFPTAVRIRLSQPPAGLGLGLSLAKTKTTTNSTTNNNNNNKSQLLMI